MPKKTIQEEVEFEWGMTEFPLIEGENVQRRLSNQYIARKNREDFRQNPVDFGVVAALQEYLRPYVGQHEMAQIASLHLTDAANEDLPKDIREEHFDLAGSAVWQFNQLHRMELPEMGAFIHVWRQAGGV